MFESRTSAGATENLPSSGRFDANIYIYIYIDMHSLMIWKVMPRNAWNAIVSWPIRQLSKCTKLQLCVLMTSNSKKKNSDLWENCQKFVIKLSQNAYIWHPLVDRTFSGQYTHLQERSQSGPELVKNAWKDEFQKSTTRVSSSSAVMWDTPLSRFRCRGRSRLSIFGNHTFVTRRQFRTVRRKQKSFLLMQVCAWMESQLSTSGILFLKGFIPLPTRHRGAKRQLKGNVPHNKPSNRHTNKQTMIQSQDKDLGLSNVDYVASKSKTFFIEAPRFTFLTIMKR